MNEADTPADDVPEVDEPTIEDLIEIQVQAQLARRHLENVESEINQQFGQTYKRLDNVEVTDDNVQSVLDDTTERVSDLLADTGGNPNE